MFENSQARCSQPGYLALLAGAGAYVLTVSPVRFLITLNKPEARMTIFCSNVSPLWSPLDEDAC